MSARGTRVVRAVDEVSLTLEAGRDARHRRRVRLGQDAPWRSPSCGCCRPRPASSSGEILFEGEDLLAKSPAEMRRIRGKRIAMILQDPMASLNPLFTVGDQVAEPLRVHERARRRSARGARRGRC